VEGFDPDHWTSGVPHLVADVRHPLLEPREGAFRNIYAPSALARPGGGWFVYYGGWDGIAEGRDAIYVTSTTDFREFGERRTVVEPGPFQHVCNVNAQVTYGAAAGAGAGTTEPGVTLMCTVYPDQHNRNKPAIFRLASPAPAEIHVASPADIATVRGYDNYDDADINGMNVLLRDGGRSLVYFGNFRNFGQVGVAGGDAASTSTFDYLGAALEGRLAVNDVKIMRDVDGGKWYLMGLHMNRGELYYSLSQSAVDFTTATPLLRNAGDADKHIVALGWVTDRDSPEGAFNVLGVLYGAGAAPTLDANRIFARWIQRQLEFDSGDGSGEAPDVVGAYGPSTAVVKLNSESWRGMMGMSNYKSGGEGSAAAKAEVHLQAGRVYELLKADGP
jgi:hypothetical protein